MISHRLCLLGICDSASILFPIILTISIEGGYKGIRLESEVSVALAAMDNMIEGVSGYR